MQFEKEHKMMHESSVIANRKLELIEREEQNDKFVDWEKELSTSRQ